MQRDGVFPLHKPAYSGVNKMEWLALIQFILPFIIQLIEALKKDNANGSAKLAVKLAKLQKELEKHIA